MQGIVVKHDGTTTPIAALSGRGIAAALGCSYFQILFQDWKTGLTVWVDEEGRCKGLQPNLHAAGFLQKCGLPASQIFGSVLVTGEELEDERPDGSIFKQLPQHIQDILPKKA
jgi:hypothetical protein